MRCAWAVVAIDYVRFFIIREIVKSRLSPSVTVLSLGRGTESRSGRALAACGDKLSRRVFGNHLIYF